MNETVTDLIVVNNKPEVCAPQKHLEKESGEFHAKVKLTAETFSSLYSIASNDVRARKANIIINNIIRAARDAVYREEERKAERIAQQEEMRQSESLAEKTKREAIEMAFKLEETISKATKKEVVLPTFDRCGAKLIDFKPARLIKNKDTKPKALMIKQLLEKYCGKVGSLVSLYQQSDLREPNFTQTENSQQMANWRGLFEGMDSPILESNFDEINKGEIKVSMANEQRGIMEEDLRRRRIIAQVGDELKEVRRLLGSVGTSEPFTTRLLERERQLRNIISSVAKIDPELKHDVELDNVKKTEFQTFIDDVMGYKVPLSSEEHDIKQQEMEEYYSSPSVQENIDKLRFQNILFDMNQPEAFDKIAAAERKDNERRALESNAVDLLDSFEEKREENAEVVSVEPKQDDIVELQKGALEQAQLLKKHNDNITELQNGAEKQARLLQRQNELIELHEEAEKQAHLLQRQNEITEIQFEAQKQARLLQKQNVMAELHEEAEKQARILQRQNELAELQKGAEEQANFLFNQQLVQPKEYELSDARSRYGSLVSLSKPIKINTIQLTNIRGKALHSDKLNMKDVLVSLREQLDEFNLGLEEESPVKARAVA